MRIKLLTAAAVSALLPLSASAGTVTTDGPDLKISTKGGFKVATVDKNYSFKVGGRIQWDYEYEESDGVQVDDDFTVRRARLAFSGNVHDWSYKTQFDVDGSGIQDLYIQYNGWGKAAKVIAGNHKIGFGLERQTSSKDISLLERSGITELYTINKQEGVSFHGKSEIFTYQLAGFEFNEGDVNGDGSDDADLGWAFRGTFGPKVDGTQLHAGFSYADLPDKDDRYGIELAAAMGPFHAQAEFFDRETVTLDQDGYYVQLGWVLTGEVRPYKDGKFKRVKPSGSSGAWELVARYDDGDGRFSDTGMSTEEASGYGFGVNWYINNSVRIGASYQDHKSDVDDGDGSEFRSRLQFVF